MNALLLAGIDPVAVVDHAADKDFRWWFLALFLIVISGGLGSLRYLVKRSEEDGKTHAMLVENLLKEGRETRAAHSQRMELIQTELLKLTREVTSVVASNTAESREVRTTLEGLRHRG